MLSMYSIGIVESVAMDENGADTPEQVLKFVPKERLRGYAPRVEEAGEAIIAKNQQAADLSNENCHRYARRGAVRGVNSLCVPG
jgi:hypothetical protein